MTIVVVKDVVAIDMEPIIIVVEPDSPNIVANLPDDFTAASSFHFLLSVATAFYGLV